MRILTLDLDTAAYYCSWGGKLISASGRPHQWQFVVEVNSFIYKFSEKFGLVPYRRFMRKRRALKELAKDSMEVKFVNGKMNESVRPILLGDIATVRQ